MSIEIIFIAIAAFLFAGSVKGAIGIGLPITAMGLLSMFLDPRIAVALSILPILVANITLVARVGGARMVLKRYWLFLVVLSIVLLLSSSQLNVMPVEVLEAMLGVMIVLFALTNLVITIPALPERFDRLGQIVAGIAGGVFGGLSGLWGPPMFIYLLARRVEKEEWVQTTGLLLLLGSIPLAIGYWRAACSTPKRACYRPSWSFRP